MSHTTSVDTSGRRALALAALGVVFGDIGTSPLYTLKEAFSPHYGLRNDHDTVLGVLSLAFWALNIVVTLKYVTIIMRADNDGEGGIMALMALAQRCFPKDSRTAYVVGILGIFGASLFFGDGVITPAVTVLSAIEGLEVVAPRMHAWIVPITVLGYAGGVIPVSIALVCVLLLRRQWRLAVFAGVAMAGTGLLNQAIKHAVARARPDVGPVPLPEHTYSFPSAHAMGATALACVLIALAWPTRWRWPGAGV